ncbi:NUDIX hydrolase domain-like protein [Podospora australis]|uniref:NUDIX hydrolase domain-like protein n=1 Tax=Podospora australis TaxID=1536484 RepID=A0AAN6WLD6_9PEZI|nr:NUDIX hydrolase domain-like protein [Podospora australis]
MSGPKNRQRMAENAPYSNLELVNLVDTWPSPSSPSYVTHLERYYTLQISPFPEPVGYLASHFVSRLPLTEKYWTINPTARTITITSPKETFESRSDVLNTTLRAGHEAYPTNNIRSLKNWSNELFPLLYPLTREVILELDGCGVDMLGIINESVFLVASTLGSSPETRKVWVARRAMWKAAWPGMLDCTAGGGLASNETPLDGIVREAWEEVRLDRAYIREHAKYVGENRLQLCETEVGEEGCQMQAQHLFEVELPENMIPEIGDGEVMGVCLLGVDDLKQKMREGEVKPASCMVWLDWMIRHGYLTEDNERDLEEIKRRLKREFTMVGYDEALASREKEALTEQ